MTSVASIAAIARMLEMPMRAAAPPTPMSFVSHIERGLKPQLAGKIAKAIAPHRARFVYSFVPKATLERRLKDSFHFYAELARGAPLERE